MVSGAHPSAEDVRLHFGGEGLARVGRRTTAEFSGHPNCRGPVAERHRASMLFWVRGPWYSPDPHLGGGLVLLLTPPSGLTRYRVSMRLLVVEDEPNMADLLQRGLQREGYAVDVAHNGEDALWSATEVEYDAIVLDVMIPAPDGLAVCRELRQREKWTPVLLLTARDSVDDRVLGLDAGADDYLVKPFAFPELFARVRSITRREPIARPSVLRVGDISLDPASRAVRRDDTLVELSPTEYSLLEHFLRHPDRVLTRSNILEHVWDFAYDGTSNVVDVYVRYLREKIDRPFGRTSIETVRGAGYVLRSPENDGSLRPNDDDRHDLPDIVAGSSAL